ncbi:nitroreductase family deazaflavin-dependent oxidoreductase [Rubrobacter tropicus]|nr:nitroreductase family deazaflavin-dependent oxidoreductase [Rubrobacter tropicus]
MPDLRVLANEDFCYLTTVGRVTGDPHEIEIWFAIVPKTRTLFMLAGGGGRSDWVKNLRKRQDVTLRISGEVIDGRARVVEDADEDELARNLLVEKYERNPGSLSSWRERALPVAVDLE